MPTLYQRYGRGAGRMPFAESWTPDAQQPFASTPQESCERLQCPEDTPAAWARKAITLDPARPFVLAAKVRCHSEERGPHVVLGVQARGRGGFWLRQGGMAVPWNDLGPFGVDGPGRRMAGFNTRDWHVYTLRVEPGWRNCHLYYDTEEVMAFTQPWSLPAAAAEDALLIGSEHPGQEIQVDWVWAGETLPPLPGLYLPTLFAVDWELQDAIIEIGAMRRHPANPLVSPGLPGARDDRTTAEGWVLRGEGGYRMWYSGRSEALADNRNAIFHAVSTDGISWRKTPDEPVFTAGPEDSWDGGALQSPVVLRERDDYTMWYAGYLKGSRQARTGIARSRDGLYWERVPVGVFPFHGSLDNNICYPLQDTIYDDQYTMPQCVIRDEDAPPERRYVLFVHAQGRNPIIGVAYSADGQVFRKDANNARYYAVDRDYPEVGRLHQKTAVLHRDGCWWTFFGYILRQGASVSVTPYFTAWRDETTDGQNPSFGAWRSTLQLASNPANWEGNYIHPSCLLEDRDEWKLYCNGSQDVWHAEIGVAVVGRERLWCMRRALGTAKGQATSRPLHMPPGGWGSHTLEVNASSLGPSSGAIRLALLDPATRQPLPGYSWEESVPLQAVSFRAVAAWQGAGTRLPAVEQDLSIRVLLEGSAKLHALRFRLAE